MPACSRRLCPHNKQARRCADCGGSAICEHRRERRRCHECKGASICIHGSERSRCRRCAGIAICEHNQHRTRCVACGGSETCQHAKRRTRCSVCSPQQYLLNLLRSRTYSLVRKADTKKSRRTLEYLGCSADEFMQHMQRKIDQWNASHTAQMTLQNTHIDHIKPCATATSHSHVVELAHFTNLQPLLVADNLAKTASWGPADDCFWRANIAGQSAYTNIYWPLASARPITS